jgi:Kef-type K+ transport system membrane component KefB
VILGVLAGLSFGFEWTHSLFAGIVLGATSVSITVQTLIELGRLRSKEGATLLAAAVVDDVVALLVLSIFLALSVTGAGGAWRAGVIVLRIAVFFGAAVSTGPLLRKALGAVQRAPISEGLLSGILVVVLAYAWAAEAIGSIASITGAYLAGILIARAGLREVSERQIKGLLYALLVPVFFVSIGLQTNARSLHLGDVPFAAVIIVAAVVGKVVGCGLAVRRAGFSQPEALRVGVGMISRGEVGLIVAAIGLQAGLLSDRGFAVMVIMVLATTIITPPLLRLAFGAEPRP